MVRRLVSARERILHEPCEDASAAHISARALITRATFICAGVKRRVDNSRDHRATVAQWGRGFRQVRGQQSVDR
eukprot:scaffold110506_cov66-Phaeocystis_antarctica.AAC.1